MGNTLLGLLILSAGIDFWAGLRLIDTDCPAKRKKILLFSMICNLGILGFFKYFNFFTESFCDLLHFFDIDANPITIHVILPLGISFYTFQSMSYCIDIYRRRLEPTRSLTGYFLMVAFFPHLVAGPIVRASRLLPQMLRPRRITATQFNAGIYLILWGLWKKVVMADNLADIANATFLSPRDFEGFNLVLGVLAFTFQIYGDFSGYTDMARGLSKLMGFELDLNFDTPYFAISPSDFWQRWHISLSSWLRDYLYISLGGNRYGTARTYFNLVTTMVLGGLWHGAAWTFILWGFYHGFLLVVYKKLGEWPIFARSVNSQLQKSIGVSLMFLFTCIGWVLFRASSVSDVAYILTHLSLSDRDWTSVSWAFRILVLCSPLLVVETIQVHRKDSLWVLRTSLIFQGLFYTLVVVSAFILAKRDAVEFIYFQF